MGSGDSAKGTATLDPPVSVSRRIHTALNSRPCLRPPRRPPGMGFGGRAQARILPRTRSGLPDRPALPPPPSRRDRHAPTRALACLAASLLLVNGAFLLWPEVDLGPDLPREAPVREQVVFEMIEPTRQPPPSVRPAISSMPAMPGKRFSSRAPRRWLMSFGRIWAFAHRTTSSSPPAAAVISWAAISGFPNCYAPARYSVCRGCSPLSPNTARPCMGFVSLRKIFERRTIG